MKECAQPLPPARPRFKPYPAYKDSGVEWLGEIPAHWEVRRLKHLALLNPESLGEDSDPSLDMIYVDIGGVDSLGRIFQRESLTFATAPSRARRLVRDGDVIVSTVRTYLRAIAPINDPESTLVVSTGFAVVRPADDLSTGYAAYALRAPYFVERVVANSKGVSFPAINESEMATYAIAAPPPEEQHAIAAFLDREAARIDALVAKKERLIELLQEKRTALITRAVTKGLDPNVHMKDSGVEWLGEIPAHWEVKRLKHLLRPQKGAIKTGPFGSQLQSVEMLAGDIKVYNQRSVLDRDFASGDNYISLEKFDELRSFETFPGDLLITTRGSIGRCAVLPADAERGILHPCVMRIQADQRRISTRFLESLIQDCGIVLEQLRLRSNATTIDVIYSESLKEVSIVVPPVKDQDAIGAFLDRETTRIDALVAQVRDALDRLTELRTALISAAVTG
ncbi:MAG: restriction endonuclease subunit S, partial [Deltaproteobacteria bacterium]|nr:restriction endonuclease subunit S [Deltaproteobacteria bacterium]